MAAFATSNNDLKDDEEFWFVFHDDGCPMWDSKFDPVTSTIPKSSQVHEVGTVLVVRKDPLTDDSLNGPNSDNSTYRPPLSAVRGRVGGYDDIDLNTIIAREAKHNTEEDQDKNTSSKFSDETIDGIVYQLGCSRARAEQALERNNGDTFETILEITGDSNDSLEVLALSSSSSNQQHGDSSGSSSSNTSNSNTSNKGKTPLEQQPFYWLEVISPTPGWILDSTIINATSTSASTARASEGGNNGSICHPGESLVRKGPLTESSRWVYKVVCADGAFIRQGLELSSPHRCTLALNSLVEISERRINGQGLSRLRTADGRGYLSEQLNPLSGARGPVVELVPLPVVLRYKVIIPEGAVVRRTRELTSPSDRTIALNETFEIVNKNFSDHPASLCVPRLELADGSGWVSERLCREPPDNTVVCEVENILLNKTISDIKKEMKLLKMKEEEAEKVKRDAARAVRLQQIKDLQKSHAESARAAIEAANKEKGSTPGAPPNEEGGGGGGGGSSAADAMSPTSSSSDKVYDDVMSRQIRQMSLNDSNDLASPDSDILDYACVVCLASPRTATIVHGETGHVACCLECARVLKARGDPCPVCRMNIHLVIQHYWA